VKGHAKVRLAVGIQPRYSDKIHLVQCEGAILASGVGGEKEFADFANDHVSAIDFQGQVLTQFAAHLQR
jgi:hypothetical protein